MSRCRDVLKSTYSNTPLTMNNYQGLLKAEEIKALKQSHASHIISTAEQAGRLTFVSASRLNWKRYVMSCKQKLAPLLTRIF